MQDDNNKTTSDSFQPVNQTSSGGFSGDTQVSTPENPSQPSSTSTPPVSPQPQQEAAQSSPGFNQTPPPPPQSVMQPPQQQDTKEDTTPITQPTPDIPSESLQVTGDKKKLPLNKIIIALVILILLGIWGFVGYTYYQNQQIKEEESQEDNQIAPIATPTEAPITYSYEIENGNIVKMSSLGESELLIDKENYEGTGITGFSYVSTSPDDTYLCFWSLPPALDPALYLGSSDGNTVNEIRKKVKECIWSPDSTKIAYVDDVAEGEASSVYFYDIATGEEVDITEEATATAMLARYTLIKWQDEDTISCSYEELEEATASASTNACSINVQDATIDYFKSL